MTLDPQSLASLQGRQFEQVVATVFEVNGWCINQQRVRLDHVEIDLEVISPSGLLWWVECKGSWRGDQPGLMRSDTTKKAVAVAYHLHHAPIETPPYVIVTTNKPPMAGSAWAMLQRAINAGAIYAVLTVDDIRRFRDG